MAAGAVARLPAHSFWVRGVWLTKRQTAGCKGTDTAIPSAIRNDGSRILIKGPAFPHIYAHKLLQTFIHIGTPKTPAPTVINPTRSRLAYRASYTMPSPNLVPFKSPILHRVLSLVSRQPHQMKTALYHSEAQQPSSPAAHANFNPYA